MIVPFKSQKTYGVLHTENYFSFLGFCKKVNSDEIQKVDVYLDNALIDTIIADKHLQKIEDIYELEGFGFSYDLSEEYIGKKAVISFKNHETQENLQNSPYGLINKDNNKFNEARFLYSLSQPIYEEKIKNIYCPNSIGFLATDINLNDQDFIEYIKTLHKKFPELIIKPICFDKSSKELLKLSFEKEIYSKFKILEPNHVNTLISEITLFCENFTTVKQDTNHDLFIYLMKNCSNIYTYGFRSDLSIKLIKKEIDLYTKVFKELNINYSIDTEINISTFKFFDLVSIAINNNQFKKLIYKFKNENNL